MKRFDLVQVNACYTTDHEMELSDDGEWVRFEDVEQALRRARLALEDTAAQASLCAHHTALTSWPHQLKWLVDEVRREANGGIRAIDAALGSDQLSVVLSSLQETEEDDFTRVEPGATSPSTGTTAK